MPVALTIAGSDPSGGAGIQADLRTFAALGVTGVSVVTALTAQNTQGVRAVYPTAPDALAGQLRALLEDIPVDAVKIGMLGGADQVRVVADLLRRFRPPRVILDPALASTGGVPLLDDAGRAALLSELLPLCDLVTPNLPECELLTRSDPPAFLLALGAKAVLVKGGHRDGPPTDLLYFPTGETETFVGPRVETPHAHGTGCLLSSAIAARLAHGDDLRAAVRRAKEILTEALRHPVRVGQGVGYPNITAASVPVSPRTHTERLSLLRGVYVITPPISPPSPEEVIAATLAGGASVVQLRDKTQTTAALAPRARRLAQSVQRAGGIFLVNDRVDIALAADADGVHLGPDDLSPEDARRLLGPDRLIGVSVGTVEEATRLAPWASYFGVGAIYGSATKRDAGEAIGVRRIREIKAAFPDIPIVGIGGITRATIAEVAAAGADAAAVVSAVTDSSDMTEAVRMLAGEFFRGVENPSVSAS